MAADTPVCPRPLSAAKLWEARFRDDRFFGEGMASAMPLKLRPDSGPAGTNALYKYMQDAKLDRPISELGNRHFRRKRYFFFEGNVAPESVHKTRMHRPLLRQRCQTLGSGEHPALALIGAETQ